MQYYFTSSTKHLSKDSHDYKKILEWFNFLGHKAMNYVHFSSDSPQRIRYEKQLKKNEISVYKLQTSLIDQSDILIAEVSRESITVGYQIDYAIRKKIPVLVLVKKNSKNVLPVMLTNSHYGLLTVEKYSSSEDLRRILKNFSKSVVGGRIKFNFFINMPIHSYISKRAIKESKSKSEILREIVWSEIKKTSIQDSNLGT